MICAINILFCGSERSFFMKQLIVLVATIILGIAVAVMVMGLSTEADKVSDSVGGNIDSIIAEYDASSGI
jgi:hypothetical protein